MNLAPLLNQEKKHGSRMSEQMFISTQSYIRTFTENNMLNFLKLIFQESLLPRITNYKVIDEIFSEVEKETIDFKL